jgi:hypothetical protein
VQDCEVRCTSYGKERADLDRMWKELGEKSGQGCQLRATNLDTACTGVICRDISKHSELFLTLKLPTYVADFALFGHVSHCSLSEFIDIELTCLLHISTCTFRKILGCSSTLIEFVPSSTRIPTKHCAAQTSNSKEKIESVPIRH